MTREPDAIAAGRGQCTPATAGRTPAAQPSRTGSPAWATGAGRAHRPGQRQSPNATNKGRPRYKHSRRTPSMRWRFGCRRASMRNAECPVLSGGLPSPWRVSWPEMLQAGEPTVGLLRITVSRPGIKQGWPAPAACPGGLLFVFPVPMMRTIAGWRCPGRGGLRTP